MIHSLRIVAVILCLLLPHAAHAMPYVEKIKTFEAPDGQKIFLEKLYAQGGPKFFSPLGVQLKNQSGTVVAFAPTADRGATFCPSLKTCIVFPNKMFQFFDGGWKLDIDHIDLTTAASNAAETRDRLRDAKTDYKSYLTYDTVTEFHHPEMGNPTRRLSVQGFVPTNSILWGLASFVFILCDSILFWPIVAGLVWLGYWQRDWLRQRLVRR
jgi:hypothetical protein